MSHCVNTAQPSLCVLSNAFTLFPYDSEAAKEIHGLFAHMLSLRWRTSAESSRTAHLYKKANKAEKGK